MKKAKTKTIAVTGGKGGTGKSTFAILLALEKSLAGNRVLLVDCDVECPNDYLILGFEDPGELIKETMAYYPEIDTEKCKKCGVCVKSCRANAIFQVPGKVPEVNKGLCSSCGVCWHVCPEGAIQKKAEKNGDIFSREVSKNLRLVTGRSVPGVRETSPVVDKTREYVEGISDEFDLCIIDTAAGTHCTVISALDEADTAYAVTEASPMGAHDLNVILQVLEIIKVPSSVVVNQYDIGENSLVDEVVKQRGSKVAVRIPYSKELAEAYMSGKIIDRQKELIELISKVDKA